MLAPVYSVCHQWSSIILTNFFRNFLNFPMFYCTQPSQYTCVNEIDLYTNTSPIKIVAKNGGHIMNDYEFCPCFLYDQFLANLTLTIKLGQLNLIRLVGLPLALPANYLIDRAVLARSADCQQCLIKQVLQLCKEYCQPRC